MASIQSESDFDKDVVHSSALENEAEPLLSDSLKKIPPSADERTNLDDAQVSSKDVNRKRWMTIYILYFTMFLSAVTFSIVLSSLWPYLQVIDYSHASATFLGWVVAAYSFGQLVGSPVFGITADYVPTIIPLIVSLVISIIFNVLYSYCGAFQDGEAGWVLLVSRGLVGFGAGIVAVVRSYVSEATTKKERTGAMAGISAAQALGFILGPALGLACVPLHNRGLRIEAIKLELDMYTGPGYIGALMGVANLLLLLLFFREHKIADPERERRGRRWKMRKVLADPAPTETLSNVSVSSPNYDRLAAAATVVLFFAILFAFSIFETIGTPLSMDEFAWTKGQAVLYNNALFGALAVLAVITFLLVKFITRKVDERVVFMIAMFLIAFGFFILIPMGNHYPKLDMQSLVEKVPSASNISASNITNPEDTVGCRWSWCDKVPAIYFFQYVLALVLLAIGYPAASVLCYAIYSKILGPFPQGMMMGVLTAAGSLARSLGPIFVTHLYDSFGPMITFAAVDGVVAVSILILLAFCHRLVPYPYSYSQ